MHDPEPLDVNGLLEACSAVNMDERQADRLHESVRILATTIGGYYVQLREQIPEGDLLAALVLSFHDDLVSALLPNRGR